MRKRRRRSPRRGHRCRFRRHEVRRVAFSRETDDQTAVDPQCLLCRPLRQQTACTLIDSQRPQSEPGWRTCESNSWRDRSCCRRFEPLPARRGSHAINWPARAWRADRMLSSRVRPLTTCAMAAYTPMAASSGGQRCECHHVAEQEEAFGNRSGQCVAQCRYLHDCRASTWPVRRCRNPSLAGRFQFHPSTNIRRRHSSAVA